MTDINERLDELSIKIYEESERSISRSVRSFSGMRTELLDTMEDYASKDNTISKSRINTLLNELDAILIELEDEFTDSIETEVDRVVTKYVREIIAALGTAVVFSRGMESIGKDVREYIYNRKIDGVSIDDRIKALAGTIRDEMQRVIRNGILLGKTVHTIIRNTKETMDKSVWRIKTVYMTEILTSFRAAIAVIGGAADIVKGIKIVDRRGRHPYHDKHQCYLYAEQDRYGMGKGVFLPRDTYIFNPHPQCTAYFHYVLHEKGEE